MDENLKWNDFYKIDEAFNVIDIDDFVILEKCETYEEAERTAKRFFEGLKKIFE